MTGTGKRIAPTSQIVELYSGPVGPVQTRGPVIDCVKYGLNCTVGYSDSRALVTMQESGNRHAWQMMSPPYRRTCRYVRAVIQSPVPLSNLLVGLTLS